MREAPPRTCRRARPAATGPTGAPVRRRVGRRHTGVLHDRRPAGVLGHRRLRPDDPGVNGCGDVYERAGGARPSCRSGPSRRARRISRTTSTCPRMVRVLFSTREPIVGSDTDALGTSTSGSGAPPRTSRPGRPAGAASSPPRSWRRVGRRHERLLHHGEQLVASDTDTAPDVYERSGGTTTLLSTGPVGGNGSADATFRAASRDGSRVFFETSEQLVSADTDSAVDVYERVGGTTTLLSTGPAGGNGSAEAIYKARRRAGRESSSRPPSRSPPRTATARRTCTRAGGRHHHHVSTGPVDDGPHDATLQGVSRDGARVVFGTTESGHRGGQRRAVRHLRARRQLNHAPIGRAGGRQRPGRGVPRGHVRTTGAAFLRERRAAHQRRQRHVHRRVRAAGLDHHPALEGAGQQWQRRVARHLRGRLRRRLARIRQLGREARDRRHRRVQRRLHGERHPELRAPQERLSAAGLARGRVRSVHGADRVHGPPALGGGGTDVSATRPCRRPTTSRWGPRLQRPGAKGHRRRPVPRDRRRSGTAADEADAGLRVSIIDVRRRSDLGDYAGELGASARSASSTSTTARSPQTRGRSPTSRSHS